MDSPVFPFFSVDKVRLAQGGPPTSRQRRSPRAFSLSGPYFAAVSAM